MRCPTCAHNNLAGENWCAECGVDLAHQDVPFPEDELSHLALTVEAGQIATPAPVVLSPDDAVSLALARMRYENIRCVLVEQDEVLVGILTERDLVLKLEPGDAGDDRRVAELMTAAPVVVSPADNLVTVIQRMSLDDVRFVPVVQGERAVGIISMRDVLHRLIPVLSPWPSRPHHVDAAEELR